MTWRPVLVGQAPGRRSKPEYPLAGGRTGDRIMELAGIGGLAGTTGPERVRRMRVYLETFARVNLLDRFPGREAKGDSFPMDEAREAAREIAPRLVGRRVVLVGRGVARAFGMGAEPWLQWSWCELDGAGSWVAVMPHPSEISHHYNDLASVERARVFLTKLARWSAGKREEARSVEA